MDRFDDDGNLGHGFTSADDLVEVDIGSGDRPRPTFVSAKLDSKCKQQLTNLLKEYKNCFAWDYTKMSGLDRSIVEQWLPMKSGFRPHQQPARRCNPNILLDIKAEITKLIEAKFIQQCWYVEWISNVVPVYKKNGKLRVCIDFRNLNKARPMDGYPMPVADLLVDAAAGHRIISFMDGNAGYNQIFMAEEDIPKTAFRCPGHVGLFEWTVMISGLKNVGATYQRAINFIFHEFIGTLVEIYIDDVVVKSGDFVKYLVDLRKILECTRKHGLKMNPNKFAFGVSASQFLGFMVHQRGIEISRRSIDAINKVIAPTNKTELQSMIGKVNFIRRFISNLSGKIKAFSPLLKLKADQEFVCGAEQQLALAEIKKYLINPLVLVPPQHGKLFRLYLSTDDTVIGSAIIQEFEGKERVIYYLSRRLVDSETRYSAIKKLCLCLYFSCIKLRHYLLLAKCTVICRDDVVKYMLSMPILSGRISKWVLALSEFDLHYELAKAVEGQVMVDFVTQRCNAVGSLKVAPWTLFIDGSTCDQGACIGIVLISPLGKKYEFSLLIIAASTNNQTEYQALVKGLELLREIHADVVEIFGNYMLVINQLIGIYECQSEVLF